jgi:hypothetical protein
MDGWWMKDWWKMDILWMNEWWMNVWRMNGRWMVHQDSVIPNLKISWLFCNLLWLAYERYPSTLQKLFGHVANKLHYSKVDTIGGNSTSVHLISGGTHLWCAYLGSMAIRWQTIYQWRLPKRSFGYCLDNESYIGICHMYTQMKIDDWKVFDSFKKTNLASWNKMLIWVVL